MPSPVSAKPMIHGLAATTSARGIPLRVGLALLLWISASAAWTEEVPPELPTFIQLEAAGARIGEIRVVVGDVFDTSDPKENKWLYRVANALHIQTRPGVIRRALLFRRGEPLSVQKLEETERSLRGLRYIYDVRIRALAYHHGIVDLEVATRDTWTLDAGVSIGRAGGVNSSSVYLEEYNLLGTGMTVGLNRSDNVDRTGTGFFLTHDRLLGTRVALDYSRSRNSDGSSEALSLLRPFHSLDARWSAGASASRETRLDSIYQAGVIDRQYRSETRSATAFAGWSAGLVEGWVRRYSLGMNQRTTHHSPEPGRTAPEAMPGDEKFAGPFLRFELLEDRYEKLHNRNLMGRPEYFELGLAATMQLDRSEPGLGSSRAGWLYSGQISRGFELARQQTVMASASMAGGRLGGRSQLQSLGTQLGYYLPQSPRWLFFAAGSYDRLNHAGPNDALLLGGDSGLRGYPLRYQSGRQRTLFTLEERWYTDWFIWRLFRFGGAAFLDTGRAWGGPTVNRANPGWLSDAGLGLRIVSVRSAFGNVLHLDMAYPLNPTPGIKKVQFLVKSKTTF